MIVATSYQPAGALARMTGKARADLEVVIVAVATKALTEPCR
jgi:hypothetical protein